jgi:hypothetical protein
MNRFRRSSFLFPVLTAAFVTIAGGALWNRIQDLLSQKIASDSLILLIFQIFSMALLIAMMNQVVQLVEGLSSKSRLTVRHYANDENGLGRVFDESRKIIEEAKEDGTCTILAVNSFTEMFEGSQQLGSEPQRRSYFEAIEKKIGKVNYHRILQVNTEHLMEGELSHKIVSSYEEHFLNIVEMRDKGSANRLVLLDQVPAKYPISFVIVSNHNDSSYLIWQVNEHVISETRPTDALKLRGVFLITDPDEQIIQYFKGWFSEISNSPMRKAVQQKDIVAQSDSKSRFEYKTFIESAIRSYYDWVDNDRFDEILALFEDKIYYKRGSRVFNGRDEVQNFYKKERLIRDGKHHITLTTSPPNVYVSGHFEGSLRDNRVVKIDFEDIFKFEDEKIIKRVTVFYEEEI